MTQSLHGLRILNTRPKHQAQELSKQITQAGGIAVECPLLEIKETNEQWINALPDLNEVDTAIFISANAIHFCFKQLEQHHIFWPDAIQVIAIGEASANTLAHLKIRTDCVPKIPKSEELIKLDILQKLNNQTVLLFKGKGGRPLIEETLLARGAKLVAVEVYERILPEYNQSIVNSIWRDDSVDIILFTSEQSMHNLFYMLGKEAHAWLTAKPCLVISERLAQSASLLGINNVIMSHPDTIIETLFDYSQGLNHGQ